MGSRLEGYIFAHLGWFGVVRKDGCFCCPARDGFHQEIGLTCWRNLWNSPKQEAKCI